MRTTEDRFCPSEIGYSWEYKEGVDWIKARKGLKISCASHPAPLTEDEGNLNLTYGIIGGIAGAIILIILVVVVACYVHKRRGQETIEVRQMFSFIIFIMTFTTINKILGS